MKITNKKFSSFGKKCLCLFSILIPCVALTANGQESFKPMLKDGRVWNCIEVYIGEEKNDTVNREYRIKGASEIDGHVCYNLCLGSKPMGIYYEEIESNAVGFKEDYEMHSMDFEEFLWAKGYPTAFLTNRVGHVDGHFP